MNGQPVVAPGLCLELCQDPQMTTVNYFALETHRAETGSPWGEPVSGSPTSISPRHQSQQGERLGSQLPCLYHSLWRLTGPE